MKKLIFILFLSTFSFAQNKERTFISNSIDKDFYVIEVSDGVYQFRFLSDKIIETNFIPKSEKFNPKSEAVFLKVDSILGMSINLDHQVSFTYNKLSVDITKRPFHITYKYDGKEILSEKNGYSKQKHIPLESVKGNIISDSLEVLSFNISSDEVLFGGGARVLGMNRRGNRLALYNRAQYGYETRAELMNFTLPIVISSKKYMVHFDNAPIGYLDLDSQKNNTLKYETISGRKTYQVIVGDSWDELVVNYVGMTGKQPMIPRWALGNFSSRFGYHSETEAIKTIQKFKDENIPVDAIILDLYWFGKEIQGTMGNLEIFRDSFPNFEKMVADFNKIGVKTITVTEPFILTTSKKWEETKKQSLLAFNKDKSPATWDFYFGNTGLVDVFKPEAQNWFWNIYKDLANKGIAGVWGDLGEPEVFPSSANTFAGTADEVHNIYGHYWAKLIADGYQKDFPKMRPFILMRAGAAGSQRYGMIPWSGDVNRTWGGLSGQTEIALQMGMQGMAYMHSDLGGFAGDLEDDELYVRWLQYGVFQPIFRPHAQEGTASEPVYRSEKAKKLAKEAIELRYKLLPYNYNLVFENSQTGKPLMRPLFFEEPENKALYDKADGYFWGNDFLIYPILKAGQKTKEVYFPKGNSWIDFYTNKKYEGGTTHFIETVENHIPTFVRSGSFIPMTKLVQTTDDYTLNKFDLFFYFDDTIKISSGQLFNDDGVSTNTLADNKFEKITFRSKFEDKILKIRLESDHELLSNNDKEVTLKIVTNSNKPLKVKVDSKKVKFNWDTSTGILEIQTKLQNDIKTQIEIKF